MHPGTPFWLQWIVARAGTVGVMGAFLCVVVLAPLVLHGCSGDAGDEEVAEQEDRSPRSEAPSATEADLVDPFPDSPLVPGPSAAARPAGAPAPGTTAGVAAPPTDAPVDAAAQPDTARAPGGQRAAEPLARPLPQVDEWDEGIFELSVERIPGRIILFTVIDPRGRVLIPVRPVVEHMEIPLRTSGFNLLLEWPVGVWDTELDPESGTLRIGAEEPRALPAESWHWADGELYLASDVLSTVVDATVTVNWADLTILVRGTPGFPAVRRRQIEAQRGRSAWGAPGFGRDPHEDTPFHARTGGASATWGVSLQESAGQTRGSGRVALGGSLLGGATEVGGAVGFGAGDSGAGDFFARYSRQVHGTEWLRRVEVGSVLSGGTVARPIVGGTLTNEPYTQPRYFDDASIMPAIPAGWEYEVYQGGNLVGFSGGESGDGIRAPLNYGNTPVTVRLIGPAGQEIVEELVYVVNPRQVPSGAWRYDVGAGSCQDARCESYGYGELRYGLLPWLTVGAGADRLARTASSAGTGGADADSRVHGTIVARPLTNLSTEFQLQPGAFFQAGARYMASSTGNVAASYTWNRPRETSFALDGWQGHVSAGGRLALPGGERSVTGRLFLRGQDQGELDSWQASVAAPVGRSFVMLDYESGLQRQSLVSARTFTPIGSSRPWLRNLSGTASISASARRAEMAEVGASFRPVPWASMQAGVRVQHGESARFTLAFASRTRAGFAQSRATAGDRNSVSMSMNGGIALQDGFSDIMILPSQGIGQAGVAGIVFHDLNGNGVRDPGEPIVEGVTVMVQRRRAVTDESGNFRIWDVRPYEPAVVAIDSLTLEYGWTPSPREVVLRPSPNLFNRVELGIVRTREVVGRVEGPEGRGVGGVTVEVVDTDGRVVVAGRTFSDGEFYLQRVPLGRFHVRVAASSERAIGLCNGGVELHTTHDGEAVVEIPPLRLRPGC